MVDPKAMDHMDEIYELTRLELFQRNVFCGRLQTTIDELNKLIKQENERRISFTTMIKDFEKTHAYRYLCSLVPRMNHRVQEIEQQLNQTPDIELSESEFNSILVKYNSLYEQYKIKYSFPEIEEASCYSMLTFKTLSSIEQIKSSKDNFEENSMKKNFEQDYLESVTEIQNLTMEIDSLKSEIDRFKQYNHNLQLELRNKHELEMEIQKLKTKITSIEKEHHSALNENESFRTKIVDSENQLAILRTQVSSMTEKYSLLQEQYQSLQHENEQMTEKCKQVSENYDKLQNKHQDDIEKLRNNVSDLEKKASDMLEHESQLKKQISDLQNENQSLTKKYEEHKKQLESTMSSQNEEIVNFKKKLDVLEYENREIVHKHEITSANEESERLILEKKVETLNQKLEMAQVKVKDLTESHATEMESLRKLLEECECSRRETESRNVQFSLEIHHLASEIQKSKEENYLQEAKTVNCLAVLDILLNELMAFLVHHNDLCQRFPNLGARAQDISSLHEQLELRKVLENMNKECVDYTVVSKIKDVVRLILQELDQSTENIIPNQR